MTCIAAVSDGVSVWMGGDSAGIDDRLWLGIGMETKVWLADHLIFGASGSFRVAQLLRWRMTLPVPEPDIDPLSYVVGPLVDAMRVTLAEGGALTVWDEDNTEGLTDSGLLVGFRGRIFEIFSDFGCQELIHDYASIGCGSPLAFGSLAGTEKLDVSPKKRIKLALAVAERHSGGVRGPMTILRLKQ